MYEVRSVNIHLKDDVLFGYERDVVGEDNILTATAATNDEETFASLVCEFGTIGFTCSRDEDTGEVNGFGIHASGEDSRDVLIKGLRFLLQTLEEESAEVDD